MSKKFASCKDLELKYHDDKCKCKRFIEHFPNCHCESESVSDYSPFPVRDDEILVRKIFNQSHIDTDGRPNPLYVQGSLRSGISVDRLFYLDEEKLTEYQSENKNSSSLLFTSVRCEDLRQAECEDGQRLFAVYDTATADNRAHAEICRNVYFAPGTPDRRDKNRRVAKRLRQLFGKCVKNLSAEANLGKD